MRKENLIMLFIFLLFLFFSMFSFISTKYRYVTSYIIKAEVTNKTGNITKIGVAVDLDVLNFGRMIVNKTNTTKILDINNPLPYKVICYLFVNGNATPFLILKDKFMLESNSKKSIYIKFHAKKEGNYTGNLSIYIRYPKNKISEWFMVKMYEKGYY